MFAGSGESVMSPEMSAKLLRELRTGGTGATLPALTPRESEILAFIAQGKHRALCLPAADGNKH